MKNLKNFEEILAVYLKRYMAGVNMSDSAMGSHFRCQDFVPNTHRA
jgi:hypothetical protein